MSSFNPVEGVRRYVVMGKIQRDNTSCDITPMSYDTEVLACRGRDEYLQEMRRSLALVKYTCSTTPPFHAMRRWAWDGSTWTPIEAAEFDFNDCINDIQNMLTTQHCPCTIDIHVAACQHYKSK